MYMAPIDPQGTLASVLRPGKTYRIRLASKDLGIKRWKYGDEKQSADTEENSNHTFELVRLVSVRSSELVT